MRARKWYETSFGAFEQEVSLVLEKLYGISTDTANNWIGHSDYAPRGEPISLYMDFCAEAQEALWTPRVTADEIYKLKPIGE